MAGGIVVFAYSEVGHACLKFLLERGEPVVALFTHEDDAGERQWFSSCAHLARQYDVPVYTVEPRESDEVERVIAGLKPFRDPNDDDEILSKPMLVAIVGLSKAVMAGRVTISMALYETAEQRMSLY